MGGRGYGAGMPPIRQRQAAAPAVGDAVDALVAGWRARRDDLDVSCVEVVARLGRVRGLMEQSMEAVFAGFGLTAAGFSALAAVARLEGDDGVPQVRLMRELGLTSGTVSVRIDRLVADGLAVRGPDPDDRRGTRIRLTERGRALFERAAPAHLENERRLLAALSAGEREHLAGLLRILLLDLEGPRGDDPAAAFGLVVAPAHETAALRAATGLPACEGLLVREVLPDGPGARAGVLAGDVLCAVGDAPVRSIADLAPPPPGPLTVVRGGRRVRLG